MDNLGPDERLKRTVSRVKDNTNIYEHFEESQWMKEKETGLIGLDASKPNQNKTTKQCVTKESLLTLFDAVVQCSFFLHNVLTRLVYIQNVRRRFLFHIGETFDFISFHYPWESWPDTYTIIPNRKLWAVYDTQVNKTQKKMR